MSVPFEWFLITNDVNETHSHAGVVWNRLATVNQHAVRCVCVSRYMAKWNKKCTITSAHCNVQYMCVKMLSFTNMNTCAQCVNTNTKTPQTDDWPQCVRISMQYPSHSLSSLLAIVYMQLQVVLVSLFASSFLNTRTKTKEGKYVWRRNEVYTKKYITQFKKKSFFVRIVLAASCTQSNAYFVFEVFVDNWWYLWERIHCDCEHNSKIYKYIVIVNGMNVLHMPSRWNWNKKK